jgi:hypothetical protein
MNKLDDLIQRTFAYHEEESVDSNYGNSLFAVLRKNHYSPALQIKRFVNSSNMVLLHNTYKRDDTDTFQELYNECRSVILDFDIKNGNNVVVSYSDSIPKRMCDIEYEKNHIDVDDIYEKAYESTMIYVYHHNDIWYFGTNSCTDAYKSKFCHPTKSHGKMFDEALKNTFQENIYIREEFTKNLDKTCAYEFALMHYENTKYLKEEYIKCYGENYKFIIHIATKKQGILQNKDNFFMEKDILTAYKYKDLSEALSDVRTNNIYGFIVRKKNKMILKVSTDTIIHIEETNLGNSNYWRNMLWTYLQQKSDFHIKDYIKKYSPDLELPLDTVGNKLDPTYVIHTVFMTIREILFNLYDSTTDYFSHYNRFRMNKDLDKKLSPIIQFHLAQLRHLQVTLYSDLKTKISKKEIHHYLCHINSIKNMIGLIRFFTLNTGYDIMPKASMCISILNTLLSN